MEGHFFNLCAKSKQRITAIARRVLLRAKIQSEGLNKVKGIYFQQIAQYERSFFSNFCSN